MVKIVWTELAVSDLKEIFDHIAEDSERYAALTTHKIYQRVQVLVSNPYIDRVVPEFNEKFIRELIEGNYRIIYRLKGEHQIDVESLSFSPSFKEIEANSLLTQASVCVNNIFQLRLPKGGK